MMLDIAAAVVVVLIVALVVASRRRGELARRPVNDGAAPKPDGTLVNYEIDPPVEIHIHCNPWKELQPETRAALVELAKAARDNLVVRKGDAT